MNKVKCVVSCPADTYSGYGARSRDFVRALIDARPDWDICILSQRWGNTRFGYLADHEMEDLQKRIISKIDTQPEVWIQITVPNEFKKIGKYNIGVTAGIETTLCHYEWIVGCNNMDLVLASSEHAKQVLSTSKYTLEDSKTGTKQELKLNTPIEVVFEGVNLSVYGVDVSPKDKINLGIKESFCFLVMGHWMQGNFGHDRKNIAYTIKAFLETFKNKPNAPALILKTSTSNSSILDREKVLDKIDGIRRTVKGKLPNIYLLHGELTESQINSLYKNSKVKALLSLTKGEGFGRPLLEFTTTGKPVIASNWSGQTDFLNPKFSVLVGGELEQVDPSAEVKNMIMKESKWFKPDDGDVRRALTSVYKKYKDHLKLSRKHKQYTKDNFSYDSMVTVLEKILDDNIPEFPTFTELKLPKLNLPKLKKIDG